MPHGTPLGVPHGTPLPRDHAALSVFRPEHLPREARRQRGLPGQDMPALCVLDPDGDLVRHLRRTGQTQPSPGWACYHTTLDEFTLADGTPADGTVTALRVVQAAAVGRRSA